jgi:hypothetical protein
MIYKKEANFPYPLLTNTSNSYDNSNFIFDVALSENTDEYIFKIEYDINTEFIIDLLVNKKIKLVLIVKSRDNKFYDIESEYLEVKVKKSRLSLYKRTILQLFLQAVEDISFEKNNDLNTFYSKFKNDIHIPKGSILGFSNVVTFDGSDNEPFELFEKKINTKMKESVKVELGNEKIIINYKREEFQFINSNISSELNYPYIYIGLTKALMKFIYNNSIEEEVYIDDIDESNLTSKIDLKLYHLMKAKNIKKVNIMNLDEIIYLISDNILEKYTTKVRRLYTNGS